ncbi:hypothetical protein KC19_9G036200 [Ceratodon purpureus]|uniref:Uncharacterized protein n=1 Tax=Ceratodon purpureus TaxID=3225 RepID=A0A8T0GNF3_CERPU|nr:hypothetical protein KC19_9G036200 [Ceratodon purpureus]
MPCSSWYCSAELTGAVAEVRLLTTVPIDVATHESRSGACCSVQAKLAADGSRFEFAIAVAAELPDRTGSGSFWRIDVAAADVVDEVSGGELRQWRCVNFPWELGPMAAAASMNHVAGNRIDQLQGFAVALLLWFPCILAGVDSKNVNLSKEEMDGLQALWRAFRVNTPDPDSDLRNWGNSSHPCVFSSPDIDGNMDPSAWLGLTCHFHDDINYTWVDGVTVTGL